MYVKKGLRLMERGLLQVYGLALEGGRGEHDIHAPTLILQGKNIRGLTCSTNQVSYAFKLQFLQIGSVQFDKVLFYFHTVDCTD